MFAKLKARSVGHVTCACAGRVWLPQCGARMFVALRKKGAVAVVLRKARIYVPILCCIATRQDLQVSWYSQTCTGRKCEVPYFGV